MVGAAAPQAIGQIRPGINPRSPQRPQAVRGNVGEVIEQKDQRGQKAALLRELDLEQVLDR